MGSVGNVLLLGEVLRSLFVITRSDAKGPPVFFGVGYVSEVSQSRLESKEGLESPELDGDEENDENVEKMLAPDFEPDFLCAFA